MLAAAAVCGAEFRVGTVALALERETAWVDQTCEELARMQLWLKPTEQGGDASEPTYSFRHALFRQVLYERTATAVRGQLHRKVGTALEQERAAGLRGYPGRTGDEFRARPRADARIALLRRGCRGGTAAFQPRRVHEPHRDRDAPARSREQGYRARLAGDRPDNPARHGRIPSAWGRKRSQGRLPARVLAACRDPAASEARRVAA